ncbi:MAG TPA: hypothetical protein VGF06_17335 [Terriglobales bacterium]|jgi:hypothetical protein
MKKLMLVLWALALLTACNSGPSKPAQTEKPKPKEPDLVTGRFAFQKLYITARGWARDAEGYRLESLSNPDGNGQQGKSSLWRASFASPTDRSVKPYVWSGSNSPDAPSRGINPGVEDSYNPNNSSTQVFDIAFLKVDSDKAFETAQQHGGDKLLAKAADTPVQYVCDWNRATNQLVWHVIYGSESSPMLRIAVDASSGAFIRVEK